MEETLDVTHLGGDRFEIAVRGHRVVTDQPVDAGGEDAGPTPTELFVAGMGACVAFYARRYLRRHELPEDGLSVRTTWELGGRPARVQRLEVELTVSDAVPEERRDALLAVASHCTLHNTLQEPPEVQVRLTAGAAVG